MRDALKGSHIERLGYWICGFLRDASFHLGQATREERATGPPGWMKQLEGVQGEAFEADEEIGDEAYLMDARYEEDTWAGR